MSSLEMKCGSCQVCPKQTWLLVFLFYFCDIYWGILSLLMLNPNLSGRSSNSTSKVVNIPISTISSKVTTSWTPPPHLLVNKPEHQPIDAQRISLSFAFSGLFRIFLGFLRFWLFGRQKLYLCVHFIHKFNC